MVEGFRERRVVTLFGDVAIRRRRYRDGNGKRRFRLDDAMGLEKRSPLSAGVRRLAAPLSSHWPFGKCERLVRGLGSDSSLAGEVYHAGTAGNVALADRLLLQTQARVPGERAKEIGELRSYLLDNSTGLMDYRVKLHTYGLRGLGAIEGNVDKLVASRMKK